LDIFKFFINYWDIVLFEISLKKIDFIELFAGHLNGAKVQRDDSRIYANL